MEQLGLFDQPKPGPKVLADFTLKDWDVDACQEAREAWAKAGVGERMQWCNVTGVIYPD